MRTKKSDGIKRKNRETKMIVEDLNTALSECGQYINNVLEELANIIYQVGQLDVYRTLHS